MKLLADLHTHSDNSRFGHGKDTINDMVLAANEIGLKEIAITDHAYNHLFHTSLGKIKNARKKIDEINKWSNTKVLLGIEADIISDDGDLDIDDETLEYIDILIVGYHRMVKTNFAGFFGKQRATREAVVRATNAYLNALRKYPVSIISHIDSILNTDVYEIGCACRDMGVMIEIKNRHLNWSEEKLNKLLSSGCMFVVSSDAHSREDIGNVEKAFNFIRENNIPSDCIANVEFLYDEKSEFHKEVDRDFSFYENSRRRIEEKQREKEAKEKTEFTNKLSKEMSDALEEIARERDEKFSSKNDNFDENDIMEKDLLEGEAVLNEARKYFQKMGIDIDKVIKEKEQKEQFEKEEIAKDDEILQDEVEEIKVDEKKVDDVDADETENDEQENLNDENLDEEEVKTVSQMFLNPTKNETPAKSYENFEYVPEENEKSSKSKEVENFENNFDLGNKISDLKKEEIQEKQTSKRRNGLIGNMFDDLKK